MHEEVDELVHARRLGELAERLEGRLVEDAHELARVDAPAVDEADEAELEDRPRGVELDAAEEEAVGRRGDREAVGSGGAAVAQAVQHERGRVVDHRRRRLPAVEDAERAVKSANEPTYGAVREREDRAEQRLARRQDALHDRVRPQRVGREEVQQEGVVHQQAQLRVVEPVVAVVELDEAQRHEHEHLEQVQLRHQLRGSAGDVAGDDDLGDEERVLEPVPAASRRRSNSSKLCTEITDIVEKLAML